MTVEFKQAQQLEAGEVVRTADVAEIADYDVVPPCESMIVSTVRAATVPGYVQVSQDDGDPLYVRSDRLVPVIGRA